MSNTRIKFIEAFLEGNPVISAAQARLCEGAFNAGYNAREAEERAKTLKCIRTECERNRVAYCPEHFDAFRSEMFGIEPGHEST